MMWDIDTIKAKRHMKRAPIPVIRIAKDNSVKKYRSISEAAFYNNVNKSVIKTACDKGSKLKGFLFDYQ